MNYVIKKSFITAIVIFSSLLFAQDALSEEDLLQLKYVREAKISPDGNWVAYTVSTPRIVTEKPGGADTDLFLMSMKDKSATPFVVGDEYISSIQWKPDGSKISFRMKRGDKAKTQVWSISLNGGEAKQLTDFGTGVLTYKWHPTECKIGFTATTPMSEKGKKLKDKGYKFVFFEEDLKHRNLYLQRIKCETEPKQLTENVTVWGFTFNPDGGTIAADISPKNLIDHKYMFRKIYLLDIKSKKLTQLTDNPGKLGNYAFSPDGKKLTYCAASTINDHQISQVYVINRDGSGLKNLTISNFKGHVNWANWKDNNTVVYHSGEGVWSTLRTANYNGGEREIILHSKDSGIIFSTPSYTMDFGNFIFTGHSPKHRWELINWQPSKKLNKLTNSNPILDEVKLGKQEVFQYSARDGQTIEGLLIYPTDYKKNKKYPLIVVVHGGPEHHYSNGWNTNYGNPGQVLAGKGYFIFFPNYRASTGYGVDFAMVGFEDPAGVEFDDIADGIDALINKGFVDKDRVGLGGGSYGGYAAAWFSSYYTEKVKAVCMRVGISDLISKRGTSDISYEELYVHSGKLLEDMWEMSLKRSPIYYAHQSKTAVLITGGTDDTRVHPSQSLEYFRRLKMNDHPAVRMVQYPGEGHGSSKQTSQADQLYRTLDWYDWYVKNAKPFDGPMPPLDISDKYGINLE